MGDLISRSALLLKLRKEVPYKWDADINHFICNAPTVEAKPTEWIPCSERLPNDTAIHEVTAQFSNGTIYTEFAYYDESREEWWKFDDDGMVNVIAWKEHSEPYSADMRKKVE